MKKPIFYISTFILTVAIAVSARADAFSSKPLESGPYSEPIRIAKLEKQNENKASEIAATYKENIVVAQPVQEYRNDSSEATVTAEIKHIDNAPTFSVTDYIAVCNSSDCFTSKNAERGVVQYQNTFFYGHSTIAFDRLKTVYVGNEIKVVDINGRTHRYKIMQRVVKSKAYLNGEGKNDGFTAGIYSANYYGTQYSAAFMTCGDGSNNDSNYRLVLFATEI